MEPLKRKAVHGVIPPIITPLDEKECVDEEGFRKLLRYCVDGGLHGIFVAGSNGETMALTQEERNRAIRIAIDEAGKDVPVICGVMDSSTKRVIDNIKALEQMGGQYAVITPVFYARHATQDETVRHFEEISRETNISLVIYNIPPFTNQTLTPETIFRIAEIDKVVGYKDSSGRMGDFMKCLKHFRGRDDFFLMQGSTPLSAASGRLCSVACPSVPAAVCQDVRGGRARRYRGDHRLERCADGDRQNLSHGQEPDGLD